MSGIVLQTNAVKVDNRGGGYPTKMVRQEIKTDPFGGKKKIKLHMVSVKKVKGTDYVIFNCPAPDCGKRNRKSVYESKASTGDGRLSFKCYACRREIEVQRPISQILSTEEGKTKLDKIMPGFEFKGIRPGVILGPNGLPVRG